MTAILRPAGVLAVALMLALPAATPAAEDAHGGGHGAAAKNPLEVNWANSAVTVVVFLTLFGVLYATAWGPIQKGLKAREDAQFAALEEARKAREDAAKMQADVAAQLTKANEEVRALLDQARRDAEALRVREREAGVKDAQAERDRAKREIEAAKDAALREITQQAIDLASVMSAKAIRRNLTPDDHRRLLDESLAEIAHGAKATA